MAVRRRRVDNSIDLVLLEHRREPTAQVTTEAVFFLWRTHAELDQVAVVKVAHDQFRHRLSIIDDDYSNHLRLLTCYYLLCPSLVFFDCLTGRGSSET